MQISNSEILNGTLSPEEYGDYYERYINQSKGENLYTLFEEGRKSVIKWMKSLNDEQALHRYAEGKWSIKEVFGHMIDTERVMAFRALTFARDDGSPLPGFDQNRYVEAANFNNIPLVELKDHYRTVRSSTQYLFHSFTDEMLMQRGTASDFTFSVRALGYIIAGHERHHLTILNERYLPELKLT